jgi:hypothetical protein
MQNENICFYAQVSNPELKKIQDVPIYNSEVKEFCGKNWKDLNSQEKDFVKGFFNY